MEAYSVADVETERGGAAGCFYTLSHTADSFMSRCEDVTEMRQPLQLRRRERIVQLRFNVEKKSAALLGFDCYALINSIQTKLFEVDMSKRSNFCQCVAEMLQMKGGFSSVR